MSTFTASKSVKVYTLRTGTRLQSNKNSVVASFSHSLYSCKRNCYTVKPTYFDNSNSPLTQTKSNFPWISSYFPVILTRLTRTRITRIRPQLELKLISLDQKVTVCNMVTWFHFHPIAIFCHVVLLHFRLEVFTS